MITGISFVHYLSNYTLMFYQEGTEHIRNVETGRYRPYQEHTNRERQKISAIYKQGGTGH